MCSVNKHEFDLFAPVKQKRKEENLFCQNICFHPIMLCTKKWAQRSDCLSQETEEVRELRFGHVENIEHES